MLTFVNVVTRGAARRACGSLRRCPSCLPSRSKRVVGALARGLVLGHLALGRAQAQCATDELDAGLLRTLNVVDASECDGTPTTDGKMRLPAACSCWALVLFIVSSSHRRGPPCRIRQYVPRVRLWLRRRRRVVWSAIDLDTLTPPIGYLISKEFSATRCVYNRVCAGVCCGGVCC